jgi:hypothetical protein
MAKLSLAAELLWLSIDPGKGGLLARDGRKRRTAFAAADPDGGRVAPGWRAERAARAELAGAGLVEEKPLRLTDRHAAAERFRALWQKIEADELTDERDLQLAFLLASSGALAARLSVHEREIAYRRFKGLLAGRRPDVHVENAAVMTDGVAALAVGAVQDLGHAVHHGHHGAGGHHHAGGHHAGGHHHHGG